MADMKNLRRTPLLIENVVYQRNDDSEGSRERPYVGKQGPEPRTGHTRVGAQFLRRPGVPDDRAVRDLQNRVGFKRGKFARTREQTSRVDQQAKRAIKRLPKKERVIQNPAVAKEVDRQRFMTGKGRKQTQAISRALPYSEAPDQKPYERPERSKWRFGASYPMDKPNDEEKAMMSKVMAYIRSSGRAFGAKHDANMDDNYGRVTLSFGQNRDMHDALHDHFSQNLPPEIMKVVRRENFAHDNNTGTDDHSHDVTHHEILKGVREHLRQQRIAQRDAERARRAR